MEMRWVAFAAIGTGWALSQKLEAKDVTLKSLLQEMTDASAIARWPEPEFTLRQASSYDRKTVAPDQAGWFANDDFSQYIRVEDHAGRQERVMMDADGPGAIVRFWLTTVQNKKGVLRVYLDGGDEPALTFPAFDLMAGDDLRLKEPLLLAHPGYSAEGNGGNTLMLPIPYAKHCKVTWEEQGQGPRYYQINYRSYPAGMRVETFSKAELQRERSEVAQAGEALAKPGQSAGRSQKTALKIAAGKSQSLPLPAGPGAVTGMELKLNTRDERALRSVVLRMSFDGERTVWCPVTDFFGSGIGINELKGFYREVAKDGTMSCRWVMPYRESGTAELLNLGEQDVSGDVSLATRPWTWDARSMHFHSTWHYEGGLTTPPARDWNYATFSGKGVYAGDTLALYNKTATWYGEGDEKIRVDGEALPSQLGTGTEDYYNYSFAPRGIMQTPFASQVRVDEPRTQGHNVLTRTRNLDGIPFGKSLDFEIELMSWAPTGEIYAATTYWYGFPGATANIVENPAGATAVIPTLADAQAPPPSFPDAIEAESLKVTGSSAGLVHEVQDMEVFGVDQWSGGRQLLVRGAKEGEEITVEIPAKDAAEHELILCATQAPDFGVLSFTVNGKEAEAKFDGYASSVIHASEMSLGRFLPINGIYAVKMKLSGTNPATHGARYYEGIDYFKVK